jgi:outer membrane protein assembly factor BamB
LWTDNSPGKNILHGQWGSPAVGVLGGVPQVIFPGGDGWLYSFRADRWKNGKPELLWKFDCNPKEAKWLLEGRGRRNNLVSTPVIHKERVYMATGQDIEHGEGDGDLWCIDPTRRGDVSPQLVVHKNDRTKIVPHRRYQQVIAKKGEIAIPNPNSAAIWNYTGRDLNRDGKIGFEESMHRSVAPAAIKDGLLFIVDFSGLVHCLDVKTGRSHWTYDMFAQSMGWPLIADDKVYVIDEDGDVAIFRLSDEPQELLAEINMKSSMYSTPVVAHRVLYIATKSHLFAIARDK